VADTDEGTARLIVDTRDLFYHDLPEEEGKAWVDKLAPHSLKSLAEGGEYAYAGWKDVPCWYLLATEDHSLPEEVGEMFVKGAEDAGADVTMRKIAASHSPMLSQPQKTAEFMLEAAAALSPSK
jgi:pimeloyl-ACP methyl ester carboxylesterase